MKAFKRLVRFVTVIALIGGWTAFAASVHVVRTQTPEGKPRVTVVPKTRLNFHDTYVDARNWTAADAAKHSDVTLHLIQAGKAGVLPPVADANQIKALETELQAASDGVTTLAPPATQHTAGQAAVRSVHPKLTPPKSAAERQMAEQL